MSKAFKRLGVRSGDRLAPAPRRASRANKRTRGASQTECSLVEDVAAYLRMLHWHVVLFSGDTGRPDIIAFGADRVLLIECVRGDAPRKSQAAFGAAIYPHCGEHLKYILARKIDDVMIVVEAMMQ